MYTKFTQDKNWEQKEYEEYKVIQVNPERDEKHVEKEPVLKRTLTAVRCRTAVIVRCSTMRYLCLLSDL